MGRAVLRRFGEVCVPSSAAFGKVGDGYVAEVHRWATANGIPARRFAKGENGMAEEGRHRRPGQPGGAQPAQP